MKCHSTLLANRCPDFGLRSWGGRLGNPVAFSCYGAGVTTDIRIGTASWTDPGFVEDWYPPKLPASARLRWYAEHFNYVEVNATFYAIPTARTVERWVSETPDDFLFDVKLPKVLSRHRMQAKFLPPGLRSKVSLKGEYVELNPKTEQLVVQGLLRELKPLCDAKKLGAFLLQLSPSFRPKTNELTELDSLRDLLADHLLAVELRNRDRAFDCLVLSHRGENSVDVAWAERPLKTRFSFPITTKRTFRAKAWKCGTKFGFFLGVAGTPIFAAVIH
jgi:hypothetical protein